MTLTFRAKILGVRCNQYLRRALPQDAPVKRLADVLGQSRQTAARLFAGDAPTATQLTALASHFGKDFVAHVFEPLVGEMSDVATEVALSRAEALLLSLRPPGSATPAGAAPTRTAGALTSRRLPLAEIARYPGLPLALAVGAEARIVGGGREEAGRPALTRGADGVRRPDGGTVPLDVLVLMAAYRGRDGGAGPRLRLRAGGGAVSLDAGTEALRLACHAYLRRAIPPVKHLADILGQSRQTAARLLAGEAPTSAQLAALAQHFGREFVAVVFGPVVGEMNEAATASTLLRVERLLRSLKAAEEAERPPAEAGAPTPRRSISRRLPLAEISRYPGLVPAFERIRERAGRLELSEALALARADSSGGTSVNRQSPGDVLRFVYRARASRLHAPGEAIRDLPVLSIADAAYAELIAACFEESRQAAGPVLARLTGPVHRSDGVTIFTDVVALRTVDRARDGTLIYSSTFVRG